MKVDRVRAKKHLGQHFLKDQRIAQQIVDALRSTRAPMQTSDALLEVGPGTGILTRLLIKKVEVPFYALDIDRESVEYLHREFPEFSERIMLKDFLREDLTHYGHSVAVIGNFPYNISSQIFFKILEYKDRVTEVVCMLQKEVAERIASGEGSRNYGILSVLIQAHFDVEYLFTVNPEVFVPPPKVKSGVIRLTRNKNTVLPCDERLFRKVVKMAFGKRRKTLRNALKDLNLPPSMTSGSFFDKRAEQLSVQEFIDFVCKIPPDGYQA